ncbi:MAG: YesL family protein [Bariatricus sp.]
MAKFNPFQVDNPFNNFMTKVFDVVLLDILFLIGCIPIITAGASASALYYMTMKMVRDEEGGIIKGFFGAWKENLKKSIPIFLIFAAGVSILLMDLHILKESSSSMSMIMYGGCVTLLIAMGAVVGYVFPLLAKFENTVKGTIITAAKIAVTHLPQTFLILVINCIPLIWTMVSPETFAPVFIIWILIGIGAAAYLNSVFLVGIFDEFI